MQHIIGITIIFITLVQFSYSNSFLYVSEVDSSRLPELKSKLFFFENEILPKRNLDREDIVIDFSSNTITDFSITNSSVTPFGNKNVLFYFDLSLDSNFREHSLKIITNLTKFNVPKQINYFFIAFDKLNYKFDNIEIDSTKLYNIMIEQEIEEISNLNSALTFDFHNPFDFLNNLNGDKEIIIFSAEPGKLRDDVAIINRAKNQETKLTFYDLGNFGNFNFKEIAKETKGKYIQKIDSAYDASRVLNAYLLNFKESEINFNIYPTCETINSVTYSMAYYPNSYSFDISVTDSLKSKIKSDPIDKNFANIIPFESENQEFFIKAENNDIWLYDIRLSNNQDNVFQIFGGIDSSTENPFLLRKGQEYPIQIRFTPIDSALVFTQIVITSDACSGNRINITGGFPNTPPKRNTLKIIYPNCGDTLFVNDEIDVKWEGVLPRDVVQLEYSLNNGQNWDTLAKNVLNLSHLWKVPDIETQNLLIRILQLWPNNIGKTLNLNHQGEQLNTAFFSPDGNYILTSSNSTRLKIWNSNSGELVKEFYGHTDQVIYAVFSPNGEYAVSCGRDGRVIVWYTNPTNPMFGDIYRQYSNHNNWVNSVDFDATSQKVISAGQDGSYKIFNIITNTIEFERTTGDGNVRFAKFSPDNKFYAAGGRNGICRVYDINSHNLLNQLNTNNDGGSNQTLTHIDISPDGKLIATTNRLNKEIAIWDIASETKIKALYHPPSNEGDNNKLEIPNSAFFYYNNQDSLVLTSAGTESIRWDLTKPKGEDSTATFLEHSSFVYTANYNFDASRVVTASWDGFAKIWRLNERDIQMDTTSCPLVITRPRITSNPISFDYTLIGRQKDSIFVNTIRNTSVSSVKIKEINLRGRDRDDFRLLGDYKEIILNPEEQLDISMLFTPSAIGERIAILEIDLPSQIVNLNVNGFGFGSDLTLQSNLIDFQQLEIGESKEINQTLLRNISGSSIQVDSVKLINFDFDRFSYISDNLVGNSILSNQELRANLGFQTDLMGEYKTVMKVYHNDVHKASKFILLGQGVPPRIDSVTFKIDNINAVNGEIINVPIKIDKITELGIVESITGFRFRFSFNRTILEPLFNHSVVNVTGDLKTIEFNATINSRDELLLNNAILKNLEFKVALGKDVNSPMEIETITPIGDGKIVINWSSGIVNLIDICKEGGVRLIDTDGRFDLTQNYPNPASGTTRIEIEIIEKGRTHFYLIDTQGNRIKEYINAEIPIGRYELELNLNSIPSGVYFYILETENMKETKKIIINQ
jgi:WD40 repeat protein